MACPRRVMGDRCGELSPWHPARGGQTPVSVTAISAPFVIGGEKPGGRHDSPHEPDTPPERRMGRSPSAWKLPCQTLPVLPCPHGVSPTPRSATCVLCSWPPKPRPGAGGCSLPAGTSCCQCRARAEATRKGSTLPPAWVIPWHLEVGTRLCHSYPRDLSFVFCFSIC